MNTQSKNSVVPVGCTLNIQQVAPSLDLATHIASQGFCVEHSPELKADVAQHLQSGQLVYEIELAYDFGNIHYNFPDVWMGSYSVTKHGSNWSDKIGFAIFNLIDPQLLYLSGIILTPSFQGKGIAEVIVRNVATQTGAQYLALRTQSPRMWSAMKKMCSMTFPVSFMETPSWAVKYGEQAAKRNGSKFPVTPGFYNGPLYGIKPTHYDPKIQAWWDSICSFENGDAVICVGKLKP